MNESGFSWSGLLQNVTTTATGYLDKRLDIELQTKLARLQQPQIASTQTPVNNTVPNQGMFGMSSSMLLPILGIGLVAVILLARR